MPINDIDDEKTTLQDTLQDEKTTQEVLSIEEKNIDSDVREEINTTLGKEIADIVFKKYGINSAVKTVKELAYIYNMSDKEITNLLNRAKRSLRNNKNLYYYLLDYLDVDYNYGGSIIEYRDKTNVIHDPTGDNAVRLSELKTRIENDYYIREEKKELQKQIDAWLEKNLRAKIKKC